MRDLVDVIDRHLIKPKAAVVAFLIDLDEEGNGHWAEVEMESTMEPKLTKRFLKYLVKQFDKGGVDFLVDE